jgi:hypothetical protein
MAIPKAIPKPRAAVGRAGVAVAADAVVAVADVAATMKMTAVAGTAIPKATPKHRAGVGRVAAADAAVAVVAMTRMTTAVVADLAAVEARTKAAGSAIPRVIRKRRAADGATATKLAPAPGALQLPERDARLKDEA